LNFYARNFLLGMGVGIIAVSIIFFITYKFNKNLYMSQGVFFHSEEDISSETNYPIDDLQIKKDDDIPLNNEITLTTEPNIDITYENLHEKENVFLRVTIPQNLNASEISKILYDMQLVESDTDFKNYLYDMGIDKFINYGDFYIPLNSNYDNIINIISNGN
jgi:hypothetical protein